MTNKFDNFSNEKLADEIGNLDAYIKEHTERLEALKNELKSRGCSAVRGNFFAVTISESTSKRLNTEKLREALGDALDGYEIETTSKRMTIRAVAQMGEVA